jgi:hypothetical protein
MKYYNVPTKTNNNTLDIATMNMMYSRSCNILAKRQPPVINLLFSDLTLALDGYAQYDQVKFRNLGTFYFNPIFKYFTAFANVSSENTGRIILKCKKAGQYNAEWLDIAEFEVGDSDDAKLIQFYGMYSTETIIPFFSERNVTPEYPHGFNLSLYFANDQNSNGGVTEINSFYMNFENRRSE